MKGFEIINLCDHEVNVAHPDGWQWSYPPCEGLPARLQSTVWGPSSDGLFWEETIICGLPEAVPGTLYLCSWLVAQAAQRAGRDDIVSPAQGHPRTKWRVAPNGRRIIESVPGLMRLRPVTQILTPKESKEL